MENLVKDLLNFKTDYEAMVITRNAANNNANYTVNER